MTVPLIDFTDDIRTAVASAISKTVDRRYAPYKDADAVKDGVWFAIMRAEGVTKKRRVDSSLMTVDLVYQRALPAATSSNPNPLENNTFLDGCLLEVESVKALFREDGALSEIINNRWTIISMSNDPAYQPNLLLEQQQFLSLIRLEFRELQG